MATIGLLAPLPVVRLEADYIIKFEALETDGSSDIDGVFVSNSVIFADGEAVELDSGQTGPFMFVPGLEA